ncbi:type II toxin-antitoxin system ParD family antitoxin [Oscillatoria sp. CS-180]|uniref:ribbon-helix-helix domain-containing protein n=1 Tax=Oscillatoria sp. CS-180 TaxID=3021720 RepID=UPI0023310C32|nr:type II toxin-antitoxin system ParD family antitoxin [Oscillatoria sp. CS-180]MDB9529791.1 type II toxin-antitoxin system ParD family antitoxin [Oscillatoria sp. CS-180]
MSNITISLPDNLKAYVDEQVTQSGYSSADEYFQALVLLDQRLRQAKFSLDSQLDEGLNSLDRGEGIEVTDDWWKEERQGLSPVNCER